MIEDYHLHTKFSFDSRQEFNRYVLQIMLSLDWKMKTRFLIFMKEK